MAGISARVHKTKAAPRELPWGFRAFPRTGLCVASDGPEIGQLMAWSGFSPRIPLLRGRIPEQNSEAFITRRRSPWPGRDSDQVQVSNFVIARAVQTHQIGAWIVTSILQCGAEGVRRGHPGQHPCDVTAGITRQ